jgi:hypothetical protein
LESDIFLNAAQFYQPGGYGLYGRSFVTGSRHTACAQQMPAACLTSHLGEVN